MASMYGTIMDLPPFKGISEDQVSAFLEKTNIEFQNLQKGETLYLEGEPCTDIKYLISGTIGRTHRLVSPRCTIKEILPAGTVFGAERLFGLNTCYADKAVAATPSSIMKFSKEQYLRLLASDEIYLMNVLNFLSLRAQRSIDSLNNIYSSSLLGHIGYWIATMTDRCSTGIEIQCNIKDLVEITGIRITDLKGQIRDLKRDGILSYTAGLFKINSRSEILEAAVREHARLVSADEASQETSK